MSSSEYFAGFFGEYDPGPEQTDEQALELVMAMSPEGEECTEQSFNWLCLEYAMRMEIHPDEATEHVREMVDAYGEPAIRRRLREYGELSK